MKVEFSTEQQDPTKVVGQLHKMMITVACSGPDGATSVTLRARNMLHFARIAREKAGESVTGEDQLQHTRLTSPDYAIGFANKIRDQLIAMTNKKDTNLRTEAISIAHTLVSGFQPIYERILGRDGGPIA